MVKVKILQSNVKKCITRLKVIFSACLLNFHVSPPLENAFYLLKIFTFLTFKLIGVVLKTFGHKVISSNAKRLL